MEYEKMYGITDLSDNIVVIFKTQKDADNYYDRNFINHNEVIEVMVKLKA